MAPQFQRKDYFQIKKTSSEASAKQENKTKHRREEGWIKALLPKINEKINGRRRSLPCTELRWNYWIKYYFLEFGHMI